MTAARLLCALTGKYSRISTQSYENIHSCRNLQTTPLCRSSGHIASYAPCAATQRGNLFIGHQYMFSYDWVLIRYTKSQTSGEVWLFSQEQTVPESVSAVSRDEYCKQ